MILFRTLFVLVFFSVIFIQCHPVKANLQFNIVTYDIEDYGAIADDGIDDSKAFVKVFKRITQKAGEYLILIPNGSFDIDRQIMADDLIGNISLKGDDGAEIRFRGNGFMFFRAHGTPIEFLNSIDLSDTKVIVKSNSLVDISKDDLIHIESSSIFETGWNYKEHDIHRIKSKLSNILELQSPILFNYNPSIEKVKGTVYKKCHISLSNIDFILAKETEKKNVVPRRNMIIIWGVSLDMKDVQLEYSGDEAYYHIGLYILASEGLNFTNIRLKGLMYGLLMNFCRNVIGQNTEAEYCRHAYTPAVATVNVDVNNLRGLYCHSVMDAHVAFNVHYKNVLDTLATQFPNCRALGTFIEDANIYISKDAYQDYAYWSVQTLTKEYEPIYKEFDIHFNNVNYIVPRPSSFNGLSSFSCRNFIVENSTVSSISYYGDQKTLENISIKNSKVGVIRIDAQKTLVENTVMDGSLFPGAQYVFKFSGSGVTHLNRVTVKNYDSLKTYLFNMFYNQQAMNKMVISNSTIGKLKGFSNKLIYPGKKYESIELRSTNIADFSEKVNDEFPNVIKYIKTQKEKQ